MTDTPTLDSTKGALNKKEDFTDDLQEYKGQWTNLWFSTCGKSFPSTLLYPSKEAAATAVAESYKRLLSPAYPYMGVYNKCIVACRTNVFPFFDTNKNTKIYGVSHVIQIPVGG